MAMPTQKLPGSPSTRRYSVEEKAQAMRLVRQLRAEWGTDHGTVKRVAGQLGYGVESVRAWVRRGLNLPAGASLVAGFVHEQLVVESLTDVLLAIERARGGRVDVACACGLGRRSTETAEELMGQCRQLADQTAALRAARPRTLRCRCPSLLTVRPAPEPTRWPPRGTPSSAEPPGTDGGRDVRSRRR